MPFCALPTILRPLIRPLVYFFTCFIQLLQDSTFRLYSLVGLISCLIIACVLLILYMKPKKNFVEKRAEVPSPRTSIGSGVQAPTRRALSAAGSSTNGCNPSTQPSRSVQSAQRPTSTHRAASSLRRLQTESQVPSQILHGSSLSSSPVADLGTTTGLTYMGTKHIDVLPPEIFTMILQYSAVRHMKLPSPFPLRLVSRKWRDVVDDTPELWLSLDPPLNSSKCTPEILAWYKGVTSNISTRVPTFDCVALRLPEEKSYIHQDLFRHLLCLVEKSKAITVDLPPSLLKPSPVLLDTLFSPTSEQPVRRKLSDGPDLKHLRRIDWTMREFPFQLLFPSYLGLPWSSLRALPWAQLTHVALCIPMTLHDCVLIFKHATSIEDLILSIVSDDGRPVLYPRNQEGTLSRLRSLTIYAEVNLSDLFRKYPMPELRSLNFELEGDARADVHQLEVGWSQLTHVSLRCFLPIDVADNIMRKLDAVESLLIKGIIAGNGTWSVQKALPSLKSFTLLLSGNTADNDTVMPHFAKHIFTDSIRDLHVPLIPVHGSFPSPFGSLQTIELSEPICPDDFLSILSSAKDLREGKFTVTDTIDFPPPSPSLSPSTLSPDLPTPNPIYSPTTSGILSLKLAFDFQKISGRTVIDVLTLPHLTSFEFVGSRLSSDCDGFLSFLERSKCPLVKLSLNCHTAGDQAAHELLSLLSSTLEDFELMNTAAIAMGTEDWFGKDLLEKLTHGRSGSGISMVCLCPRLQHLHIRPCADANLFREMVLSRSDSNIACECGVRKLKSVGAGFIPGDWTGLEQELRDIGIEPSLESLRRDFPFATYSCS